jgi:EAL domain-containing protein (putative c-di-GMP-specific phosphodiesterase class I)
LCEDFAEESQVNAIAARIGASFAAPFALSVAQVDISASVGIAFAGRGDSIPEDLTHDADSAMYQAKSKGGARHQIIDLREQHLAEERVNLERDLRGAWTRGEMRAEYQPIVTTSDGQITGVEALLRWAHPTRGLISPATLIPLAEHCGFIADIGRWVLERACPDRDRLQSHCQTDHLEISVNVSADQLMSPTFAATVETVLLTTDTDPAWVTLEVTEGVFLQDSERALVVLNDLKNLGVMLALDDFGTGYSSLSYLKQFPVDIVKIDQAFVADLGQDAASHAIVAAVIDLAHVLGMKVVAEGVETAEQHQEVAELGCDSCQGFYFARPMSADALDTLMQHPYATGSLCLPVVTPASAA